MRKEENSRMYLLRTPFQKTAFLLVLAMLVFLVPYVVPVGQSIALSYVVGFSNRAAVVLFVFGAVAFAVLSKGELEAATNADKPLAVSHLFAGSALTLGMCVLRIGYKGGPFGEALYNINRLQLLASDLRPFRDFEYPYGPLQIYAPLWIARLLHLTMPAGYLAWWTAEWVLGVAMLWVILHLLDMPITRRGLVFWALFAWQIFSGFLLEGIQYTPVRMIGSAFFLVAVHAAWTRWRRPFLTVVLALAALTFELGISPEQAVGVCVGLSGWLLLLAIRRQTRFPSFAALLLCVGSALLFGVGIHFGLFISMFDFAGGAYAIPLLPAPGVLLILFAYVVAACATVRELRRSRFEALAIPMTLGGFAMLPAAMGRCDLGHLQIAAGAFLFGVGTIESLPTVRRWWSPLTVAVILLPVCVASVTPKIKKHLQPAMAGRVTGAIGSAAQTPRATVSRELPELESSPLFPQMHPPCAVVYRTPNIVQKYDRSPLDLCLETGYYAGFTDILTSADIAKKIAELDQAPHRPLLLFDRPLPESMAAGEQSVSEAQNFLYPDFLLPRARNRPLTYAAIIAYIEQNYVPDAEAQGGFRVWRPRGKQ